MGSITMTSANDGGVSSNETLPNAKRLVRMLLPTWFPLLGWALSIVLVCSTFNKNIFWPREEGIQSGVSSVFTIPSSVLISSKPSNQTGDVKLVEYGEESENAGLAAAAEDLSYCSEPGHHLTDYHLMYCAYRIGRQHERQSKALGDKAPPARLAFMFITRGYMPHERLWERFFLGHEELYSLYVHTAPKFKYPTNSFFFGHQVPSRNIHRFTISLVDAMRRILAYSILDAAHGASNSWFIFLCESSIPIRSFQYTYDYLSNSQNSFVESFRPMNGYLSWDAEPFFTRDQLRKGELWMALQLRHALMIMDDWSVYYKFKTLCREWCTFDEQYVQTLLGLKDPQGVENRTTMYVDWLSPHVDSPFSFEAKHMTAEWFQDIQNRKIDTDGEFQETSFSARSLNVTSRVCYYNGNPNHNCFLFARKVSGEASEYLNSLPPSVLGY